MIATFIAIAALAASDDSVRAFVDACERRRPEVIAELESQIKAKRVRLAKHDGDAKELRKQIDQSQKDVDAIKRFDERCLIICAPMLSLAAIERGHVMLGGDYFTVAQVIDSRSVLIRFGSGVALLTEIEAENATTGCRIISPPLIEYVGTATYETIIGSPNTVTQFRPFQIENAKAVWRERHPAKK